ncbi:hypothetical protein EDD86DRAFT_226925 [Gorgonomyces haynaldii]|nr:hypothetical protein EDD86DRAFT_226925 [Gorgonomyces haynaldii]
MRVKRNPCTFCKETKRKCDLKQPCGTCSKSKTPRVCHYQNQIEHRSDSGRLFWIGFSCAPDLSLCHPLDAGAHVGLLQAVQYCNAFLESALPFEDRWANAQQIPQQLMQHMAQFTNLKDVMDCVRALHIYGFIGFYIYGHDHSNTLEDPFYCLKKSVELTRMFLLQPTTFGESEPKVNVQDTMIKPPYSSWIDFQSVSAQERGERLLLISLVHKTDTYTALVDNERFQIDEWEVIETRYLPTMVSAQPKPRQYESIYTGTWFDAQAQEIFQSNHPLDAITFAQMVIHQTHLLHDIVIYSRRQRYASVSSIDLSAMQMDLHIRVLRMLRHFQPFLMLDTHWHILLPSALSMHMTTCLLTMLTVLHFDTVQTKARFQLLEDGPFDYESQDVLFHVFETLVLLVDMVSPPQESQLSPYFLDTYVFIDTCTIGTTCLAAFLQMGPSERTRRIAHKAKHHLLPIAHKLDNIFSGALRSFDKMQSLLKLL